MGAARGDDGLTPIERAAVEAFMGPANGEQTKAWRIARPKSKANDKSAREEACKLFSHPNVKAEIARRRALLTEKVIEAAALTKVDVMNQLQEDRHLARQLGKPEAAIKANELLGKELGMFVERSETGRPGDFEEMRAAARKKVDERFARVASGKPGGGAKPLH